MKKIFRVSTIPLSLNFLLKGQLRFLNQFYDITAISGNGSNLDEVRKREGVKTKAITIQRKISIFKDFISLIKLYLYFQKEKPEIVHSITPKAGLLSMIAAKLAGVPIRMHTFTGLIFPEKTGNMRKVLIFMDKLICRCATNVYPEGNGVKITLESFKITDKPLKVLANGNINGVDLDYLINNVNPQEIAETKQKLGIKEKDFVYIFVGRLVRDKGINELVLAFKNLNLPNSKLLLVGNQENDDPISKESELEIENNPNIISVGFQRNVKLYFAVGDALVFPSFREGFPNAVLQAGAMGIPSIVTDINGSNEIITTNYNGLIIPSKNVKRLEAVMAEIVQNEELYQKLKANSRPAIVERFDCQLVWDATKAEYERLLKQNV